ncbi:Uncharacterised protein [Yersinia similis]|uniref:Uncharacterized protein n=1 Tax=Yersinia similis TaxID=367190 RepID=A0A0T9QJF7_9GAMM|nr:Uncharacterised protein [Yersinia similis]CNE97093.1 Uncharacterised protein [Yersinia similis]CNE99965.1 Uncharacterised protein [Yersinia similis]CNI14772.1 Uncharacterised protein [Yersinia similis]
MIHAIHLPNLGILHYKPIKKNTLSAYRSQGGKTILSLRESKPLISPDLFLLLQILILLQILTRT